MVHYKIGAVNDIFPNNVKSAINIFKLISSGKSSASQNLGSVKKTDSNGGPYNSLGSKGKAKKAENSTKNKTS